MRSNEVSALRFPGTPAGLDEAARSLGAILEARQISPELRYDVEVIFEELAGNIVRHGKPAGEIDVGLAFHSEVVLTFEDDGAAFDPREQPAPPEPGSLEEARVGGLGLVLVRQICSRVEYERTPAGRNRLTVSVPPR